MKNGVHETTEYLELFLRNLLLDEKNELHNRTMHISGRFAEVDIERVKVDIKSGEVDIESTKVDIRNKLLSFSDTISEKTINHTVEIFSKCGKENCFGRTIVEEITGLKPSRASKLIKLLVDSEVIVPVTGHGKELLITEDANLQNVFFLFITIWKGSILSTFGQRHLRLRIKRLQF